MECKEGAPNLRALRGLDPEYATCMCLPFLGFLVPKDEWDPHPVDEWLSVRVQDSRRVFACGWAEGNLPVEVPFIGISLLREEGLSGFSASQLGCFLPASAARCPPHR